MRALIQRVSAAAVTVDGVELGRIGRGLVILLGVRTGDTAADADFVAAKCANLRIFEDTDGKFNLSALDVRAELLVVSQFTLYADCSHGRRPSFTDAAPPPVAEPLYEHFVRACAATGLAVRMGRFGAHMLVSLTNDGPVTVLVESKSR